MNTVFSIHSTLLEPLQQVKRWWAASYAPASRTVASRTVALARNDMPACAAPSRVPATLMAVATPPCRSAARMPLRIVRVVEAGQARASVGRMVISGRMADVCAELDRLVDREAALS